MVSHWIIECGTTSFRNWHNGFDASGTTCAGMVGRLPFWEASADVDDLALLTEQLRVGSPHLIGISLGGCIATDFAIAYADRVRDMVLIDPYYPLATKSPFDEQIRSHMTAAREGTLEDGLSRWLDDPLFRPMGKHETLKTRLEDIVLVGHGALGEGAFFVNADKEVSSVRMANRTLADIRCQVLCLVGEHDLPRFHAVARFFLSEIDGIQVVEVPDAGHLANMENPEFVMSQINRFLPR